MSFLKSKREREMNNIEQDLKVEDDNVDSRLDEIIERDQSKISNFFENYFSKTNRIIKRRRERSGNFLSISNKEDLFEYNKNSAVKESNQKQILKIKNDMTSVNETEKMMNTTNSSNIQKQNEMVIPNTPNTNGVKKKLINIDMTEIIKEITSEIDKEKRNNVESNFEVNNNIERESSCVKKESLFNIQKTLSVTNLTVVNNIPSQLFIKCRESQFSCVNQSLLTLKYKKLKAKIKVDYLPTSIHKPNIINISEFCNEYQRSKLDEYLKRFKLSDIVEFLAENVIACFNLDTNNLTFKDKEILENYFKIMYSLQLDDKFAILENCLNEDKVLIMIEQARFMYSPCLPEYEFFIISVQKSIFNKVQNSAFKIERKVVNVCIEAEEKREINVRNDTQENQK